MFLDSYALMFPVSEISALRAFEISRLMGARVRDFAISRLGDPGFRDIANSGIPASAPPGPYSTRFLNTGAPKIRDPDLSLLGISEFRNFDVSGFCGFGVFAISKFRRPKIPRPMFRDLMHMRCEIPRLRRSDVSEFRYLGFFGFVPAGLISRDFEVSVSRYRQISNISRFR